MKIRQQVIWASSSKKKTGVNVGQMATSLVLAIITMVGQIVINTTIDHANQLVRHIKASTIMPSAALNNAGNF